MYIARHGRGRAERCIAKWEEAEQMESLLQNKQRLLMPLWATFTEGRKGDKGRGGEVEERLNYVKIKLHLAPSRYLCLSYCSHPTISWWGGEDYFFFNLKNPPLPLFLCHPILYYARTPTISDEGLLVIGILQAWLCKKFVDKYFNIFYFMQ